MGRNPDVHIDNLKQATGIQSDYASDHAPGGRGSETTSEDFLTVEIGRRVDDWTENMMTGSTTLYDGVTVSGGVADGDWDTCLGIPPTTVQSGTSGLPDSGGADAAFNSIGPNSAEITFDSGYVMAPGDRFWIRVHTGILQSMWNDPIPYGHFFMEQILQNGNGLDIVALNGCTFNGGWEQGFLPNGYHVIDIEMKCTDYAYSVYGRFRFEDNLNTDVALYGNPQQTAGTTSDGLNFSLADVMQPITFLDESGSYVEYTGGSGSVNDGSGGSYTQGSIPMYLTANVWDRGGSYNDLWLWVYVYDGTQQSAIGCPGDGWELAKIQMTNYTGDRWNADLNHPGEPITVNSDPIKFRYVVTDGSSSSSTVVDQRDNQIAQADFPGSFDSGRYTRTMGGSNSKGAISC